MAESAIRAVVAGGGVAGLETLMGLHALAGDRLDLTLVAPDDAFVYRPLSADEAFAVGRTRRVALSSAAGAANAGFLADTITAVDPQRKRVTAAGGDQLAYDTLVLAVGAEPVPALEHALTWDDRAEAEMIGGLLRDVEEGYTRRVAVAIPPGPGWPLRGYELALLIALEGQGMGADVDVTLVTPEPPPLALLGSRAVEAVSAELDRAGVSVVSAEHAHIERRAVATLVLQPSGQRLEVERVLALPLLRGRRIAGVPADGEGFLEVDDHCRVRGLDRVWAVGDGTAFPVKSGGLAAEQGDVAAHDIAASAGAAVEPRSFDPTVGPEIQGLPAGRFLSEWLLADDEGLTTNLPGTAIPVLTYLQRDFAASWRGRR